MNRIEIKEAAKAKIRGNKWNIWWPILVIGFLMGIVETLLGANGSNFDIGNFNFAQIDVSLNLSTTQYIGVTVCGLISAILMACYVKYIINFVRTGEFNSNDIIDTLKAKWLNILIASILSSIVVALCTLLFVIPGIIMALAYTIVIYLVVDTDISGNDALKRSREMMKGHKWEYFVFQLSFIGWILLIPFTLGLLIIWLYPYMIVAQAMFYENIKSLN